MNEENGRVDRYLVNYEGQLETRVLYVSVASLKFIRYLMDNLILNPILEQTDTQKPL